MARVERGNVVLHVDDADVGYYVNMGYNHTDERGNVITASLPKDVATLQKAYIDNLAKIESLEATIATLTAEIDTLKKPAKASSKKATAKE